MIGTRGSIVRTAETTSSIDEPFSTEMTRMRLGAILSRTTRVSAHVEQATTWSDLETAHWANTVLSCAHGLTTTKAGLDRLGPLARLISVMMVLSRSCQRLSQPRHAHRIPRSFEVRRSCT